MARSKVGEYSGRVFIDHEHGLVYGLYDIPYIINERGIPTNSGTSLDYRFIEAINGVEQEAEAGSAPGSV